LGAKRKDVNAARLRKNWIGGYAIETKPESPKFLEYLNCGVVSGIEPRRGQKQCGHFPVMVAELVKHQGEERSEFAMLALKIAIQAVRMAAGDSDAVKVRLPIPASRPMKIKMRNERLIEIGLSASGFCSESNPSPGSKISTPVFGFEAVRYAFQEYQNSRRWQPEVIHRNSPFRWTEVDR